MNFLKMLTIFFIRVYQWTVSPMLGPNCRFSPSCSEYTVQCFQRFSFAKALWYSGKRICKCHPFSMGGPDPIPRG